MFASTMLDDYQNRLKRLTEKKKRTTNKEELREINRKIEDTIFVIDYLTAK